MIINSWKLGTPKSNQIYPFDYLRLLDIVLCAFCTVRPVQSILSITLAKCQKVLGYSFKKICTLQSSSCLRKVVGGILISVTDGALLSRICVLFPPGLYRRWWKRFPQQTWCANPFFESRTPDNSINLYLTAGHIILDSCLWWRSSPASPRPCWSLSSGGKHCCPLEPYKRIFQKRKHTMSSAWILKRFCKRRMWMVVHCHQDTKYF